MSNQIFNIGSYCKTDSKGYLVSSLSQSTIGPRWRNAVNDFVSLIKSNYLGNTHSIYLRGSVATGTAIEGISDIDFLVITKRPVRSKERNSLWARANLLNKRYPSITRFDVGFYSHKEILHKKERALVKLTALCLYGENSINQIPKLKPGKDVAIHLPDLKLEIRETVQKIDSGYLNPANTRTMCTWIMKRLVRAGFELTSERSQCFTRDLYKCWEMFGQYYPEKKDEMYKALNLAINPTANPDKIKEVIMGLGGWIIQESNSFS